MAYFEDVFDDVTKEGHKIPKESYLPEGLYPIIDQGQEYIAGYSNEKTGLYENVPAIIFGDHTRIIKYVDMPCFLGADGVKLLRAKIPEANYKYLYYALCNARIPDTGYNRHFKWLKKIDIPLPEPSKQRHVVSVLDKINDMIALRKQQLAKLDELVKSRFVEMFGDSDEYEATPLAHSVEEMFIGPFGSSLKNECFVDADEGYCMVYEQKHAIKKTMDVDTRFVDEKKYKELRRFTVQGGDIIVSCRGTIGETFIIPDGAPMGIMHPSIMKIRLKNNAYNRIFFNQLLQNVLKRHEAEANGSGIKMAITATALGKESFIRPPLELQEQFAAFVEQTDKSRLTIQRGLDKLEMMKKALMQQYFG